MQERQQTGIAGLDDILGGGLPKNRLYLVKGTPGVGKTTLALQFLIEGARLGERVLYITLSETEEEVRQVANSHHWSLDGVTLYELSSAEQTLRLDNENTLYSPAEVDLKETVRVLLDEVDRVKPERVAFDSLSEIRLLAQTPIRYRRQLLALKQHFAGRACTVLLLDDRTDQTGELQVESLAHGVIVLEQTPMGYGADRRRLRVSKLRGAAFRSGYHDFIVQRGGLQVFPRLVALEHRSSRAAGVLSSGIKELDNLLGGGLDRSTSTFVIGPAGTGKSAISTQFVYAAAERGETAALFLFEERMATLRQRSIQLGMALDAHIESKKIQIHQIDPAELAPDEFTHMVRRSVETDGAGVVVIDSINGYVSAMLEARHLSLQELLSFLNERGVASIVTMVQQGMIGGQMVTTIDVSYLADSVILLRYFEVAGRVRKALSVLKKRSGAHEDTIRELTFSKAGIALSPPLLQMRGVLTGTPVVETHDSKG